MQGCLLITPSGHALPLLPQPLPGGKTNRQLIAETLDECLTPAARPHCPVCGTPLKKQQVASLSVLQSAHVLASSATGCELLRGLLDPAGPNGMLEVPKGAGGGGEERSPVPEPKGRVAEGASSDDNGKKIETAAPPATSATLPSEAASDITATPARASAPSAAVTTAPVLPIVAPDVGPTVLAAPPVPTAVPITETVGSGAGSNGEPVVLVDDDGDDEETKGRTAKAKPADGTAKPDSPKKATTVGVSGNAKADAKKVGAGRTRRAPTKGAATSKKKTKKGAAGRKAGTSKAREGGHVKVIEDDNDSEEVEEEEEAAGGGEGDADNGDEDYVPEEEAGSGRDDDELEDVCFAHPSRTVSSMSIGVVGGGGREGAPNITRTGGS